MQQKKYESLLKGSLKPLGNFVDQALQHYVPYDMFRILCLNCVPFLHKEPIFNQLHEKWFQERNDYYRIYKQKEKEAVEQIKNTYHIIKERIVLKNLQKNRKIVQALQNVEQVLNGQDKCCIPPYYETASTQIVNLFRLLLLKKKSQLLEGLAEFQNVSPSSKPSINKLLFAPSLDELHQFNKRKNWENLHDFWLLWDRLWLAHWCWVNSDKYFQGQELRCRTLKACNESSTLFDLYLASREMYTIRERIDKKNEDNFFTPNRFKNYLTIIMDHIFIIQDELLNGSTFLEQSKKPYALELKLENKRLHLIVEWTQNGETSVYFLHRFYENSTYKSIIDPIFANPPIYTISLEESTGNNGDKYLERIGLEGELRKVFVSNNTTDKITFQGTRVELNDLTSINRPELLKEIDKLKLIEGNFSHLR